MKIRGLNLPGTPWACPGLLRETFTFTFIRMYINIKYKGYSKMFRLTHVAIIRE